MALKGPEVRETQKYQHPACPVWWLSGDEILRIYIGFGIRHKDPVMNQSVEWNVCEKNSLIVWVVFLGGETSKMAYGGKLWLQPGSLVFSGITAFFCPENKATKKDANKTGWGSAWFCCLGEFVSRWIDKSKWIPLNVMHWGLSPAH